MQKIFRRVVLQEPNHIHPFNEPARDLRVLNKPLWLHQRDVLSKYVNDEREYPDWKTAQMFERGEKVETLIHRDNIFFNQALVDDFITKARAGHKPVRLAFRADDPAIREHVLPLTKSFFRQGDLVLANMWYLPNGVSQSVVATPLIIETEARERGYYHIPPYMASETGDLVYQLPRKAFVLVESWVHIFVINILFGVFAQGANREDELDDRWIDRLKVLWHAIMEQKQVLSSSSLVKVGNNVNIHPSAHISGPTIIGNNVTIGAGTVIDNCIIGNNVNISQGCQLMLSVVSDGCFLPFRAALFMTTLMENTMVAQNTCLQLCVIGRDSFIGAGSTFTDFNVLPSPIKASIRGELDLANLRILGGCVGHHCRLSSGLIIQPARTIESDTVILSSDEYHFISKNVTFEQSDHHPYSAKYPYPRLYPRREETEDDNLL
ncbi:MAG TPA: multidrug transporter [Anaerolineae bacterium]|nr:multidrug transporter [Anaerolineae bacterium]